MKTLLTSLLTGLSILTFTNQPLEITWNQLKVDYERVFGKDCSCFYSKPFFTDTQLSLNGKNIEITGTSFPFDGEYRLIDTSFSKTTHCLVISGDGSIEILNFKDSTELKKYTPNTLTTIKGTLHVNTDSTYKNKQLYSLRDVEVLE